MDEHSSSNTSSQPTHSTIEISQDVFSSGQVLSKLWLCEELERLILQKNIHEKPLTLWIYGGWEGLLSFLIFSRNQFQIDRIRSFDLSDVSTTRANKLLEAWVYQQWKFRAFTQDCNLISPSGDLSEWATSFPDIVVNTSVEHFDNLSWWDNLPDGQIVVLQNSPHHHENEITQGPSNLKEFLAQFPLRECWFEGERSWQYPHWTLTRQMCIGIK